MHGMPPEQLHRLATTHALRGQDPRAAAPYPDPHAAPPSGGYQRYREMTLDELLLENRVIFLIGEDRKSVV